MAGIELERGTDLLLLESGDVLLLEESDPLGLRLELESGTGVLLLEFSVGSNSGLLFETLTLPVGSLQLLGVGV